jgi:hypothetical protein
MYSTVCTVEETVVGSIVKKLWHYVLPFEIVGTKQFVYVASVKSAFLTEVGRQRDQSIRNTVIFLFKKPLNFYQRACNGS